MSSPRPRLRRWAWRALLGCFALLFATELALAVAVLPFRFPVEDLRPDRGAPLLVLDRHGERLALLPGAQEGRREWVPLDRIPSHAVLALIASEDARFFEHAGVDPAALVRAAWLDLRGGKAVYGGSTITMQLVRQLRSQGKPRGLWTKLEEAVLAMRLERALSKREILEQYLNRAPFGHGASGLEAAAQTYFAKPAVSLSVGEATLLAVLVRGPATYDPLAHRDRALRRRDHVLDLVVARGWMTAEEADRARRQALQIGLYRPAKRAPHFVDWAISTLPPEVRARGGVVRTTVDARLQAQLQLQLASHVTRMRGDRLQQAGLLILDSQGGEVLALVGSTGAVSDDGQVNIVTRRRHPGSALKPFVYALALEQGESPASVAYDIRDVPSAYRVHKLTQPEHGPVRYREALAGSYNLAAVHVLEHVGADRLITRLRQAGVGPLDGAPAEYGLRLALGSAKVRLLDLAAAYGFLVRQGRVTAPGGVLEVTFADGSRWRPAPALERRLFSPEVAWQVMDMLSDPEARRPAFGDELPLDLPFPVAAKTGTARGFSDTVAVGVTREVTVAAWAGNFDGRPTHGLVAMESAAPLVRAGLLAVAGRGRLTLPARPGTLHAQHVCALSGQLAGPDCPHRKLEHFTAGQEPRQTCRWHQRSGDRLVVHYPPEVSGWVSRQRTRGGQHL
jgi:penicillin-binding protein 1C